MPFVPVPNCALLELRGTLDGQRVENTLWFSKTSPMLETELLALCSDVGLWWKTSIAPALSHDLTIHEIQATDQSTASGAIAVLDPSPAIVGESPDKSLPNNCAFCVSIKSGLRGRKHRGRNFVMGIPESVVTNSHASASFVNAIHNGYQALLTATSTSGFQWVVVSRFSGPPPHTIGSSVPVVGAAVFDDVIDSQRRRLPGRGV
jgi:hypothetical protein